MDKSALAKVEIVLPENNKHVDAMTASFLLNTGVRKQLASY